MIRNIAPLLSTAAVAGVLFGTACQAATIVLVTSQGSGDGYVSFLQTHFPGYEIKTGTYTTPLATPSQAADLNNADLVIFSRNSSSGEYTDATGERQFWNTLATPILMSNAYVARGGTGTNPRLGWFSGEGLALGQNAAGAETTVTSAGAAAFGGSAGARDFFSANIDLTTSGQGFGGGTLFATGPSDHIQSVYWDAGSSAANGDVFGGPRLYFAAPGGLAATADGTTALVNAINHIIPEPSHAVLLGISGIGLLFRRRR